MYRPEGCSGLYIVKGSFPFCDSSWGCCRVGTIPSSPRGSTVGVVEHMTTPGSYGIKERDVR